MNLAPEIVFVGGRLKLLSSRLAPRVPKRLLNKLQPVALEGRGEWFAACDVSGLLSRARAVIGHEVRLAGKRVTQ